MNAAAVGEGFSAGDMAEAAADGFRDGVAQAQGGGEVVAWRWPSPKRDWVYAGAGSKSIPPKGAQPLYAAPPSAPVGVGDGPIDASDNAEYIEHCADRLERCGLRITAGALRVIAHEHRALAQQPAAHPDDAAVDAFAAAMKEKLAAARAKGRGGWNGDEPGMRQRLSDMLRAHVEKGDPRDVANFAMFLHQRGEAILPAQKPAAVDGAGGADGR